MKDLLHVYGQGAWHDTVEIAGDPDTLERLARAILNAVHGHSDKVSEQVFTSDGEGYDVNVYCLTAEEMDGLRLPYFDEIAVDLDSRRMWPFEMHRRPDRPRREQRLRPPLPTVPNPAGDHQADDLWQRVWGWLRR